MFGEPSQAGGNDFLSSIFSPPVRADEPSGPSWQSDSAGPEKRDSELPGDDEPFGGEAAPR